MKYAIALVCDFPPNQICRMLDVYRFFRASPQILLVRRKDPNLSRDDSNESGIETLRIPLPAKRLEEHLTFGSIVAVLSAFGYLLSSIPVVLMIRSKNVRLVHAHFVLPQGLVGLVIAFLLRVPLIITAPGQDINSMMIGNSFFRVICRFVLSRAYVTIAVSKPLLRNLQNLGISNAMYLPNSIDIASIKRHDHTNNDNRILFVGRFTENKRPLTVVKAFEKLLEDYPSAVLSLCGDGPLRKRVFEETVKMNLQGKVKIFGEVTQESLNEIRSKSAVFVLPSKREGLSFALLEAMAAGLVLIVSRNESHCSIVRNGETGLLFQVDDVKELAKLILETMTNLKLRLRLSKAAKSFCEREFSNSAIGPRLEAVYARALYVGNTKHKEHPYTP